MKETPDELSSRMIRSTKVIGLGSAFICGYLLVSQLTGKFVAPDSWKAGGELALVAALFISSIGLLLRMEWARISFVYLSYLSMALAVIGAVLGMRQLWLSRSVPADVTEPEVKAMLVWFEPFTVVFFVFLYTLFRGIAKTLTSAELRKHFAIRNSGKGTA